MPMLINGSCEKIIFPLNILIYPQLILLRFENKPNMK